MSSGVRDKIWINLVYVRRDFFAADNGFSFVFPYVVSQQTIA